ncbi:MAG TPA: hypothetical protein VGK93_00510 [Candidatus Eisenbacteria bacterium]|jgi:hypothetical protein
MKRGLRRWATAAWVSGALAGIAFASAADPPIEAQVGLRPGTARLGERVVYRGQIRHAAARTVRWLPPEPTPGLTWGIPRHGYAASRPGPGRVGTDLRRPAQLRFEPPVAWVEIPVQVFVPGAVPIGGLRFEIVEDPRLGPRVHRLPVSRLVVVSVMTSADSQASLRPLRGPLAAPWWERVPWRWVILGLMVAAAAVVLLRWIRRRRAAKAPVTEVVHDPATEALVALRELRALGLPERGRFAEHAFRLGQILRRYLEATIVTTRPGDTTPELVAHLGQASLDADELRRLAGLLRTWDRVKFARDPFTIEEARRGEGLVEGLVGRLVAGPARQVA